MNTENSYMSEENQVLPVLPLKNTVVYPELIVPLAVGRPMSLAAVKAATETNETLIAATQTDGQADTPGIEDLYPIATLIKIKRIERGEGGAQVLVQGVERVKIEKAVDADGYLCAHYAILPELVMDNADEDAPRTEALLLENLQIARQIAELYDPVNGVQVFQQLVASLTDPITQMYRIASLANFSLDKEQQVLAADTSLALMEVLHELLEHELSVNKLRQEIAEEAKSGIESQQREHILRQQKRAIEQALGEEGGEEDDTAELREKLAEANLPEPVQKEADRELKRLSRMSPNAADYQVARSYLELIAELPWQELSEDALDLEHAMQVLNEDHFGLEEIKDRILENLSVLQLNPDAKAPILCLLGPPGVGKTSLGQSIARAMSRKFERLSLGGLHDEAELRGHRRTYIGAMPGRIIQAIRRSGVKNPVLMLDEIDKMGSDFRGDPSAALMEILDPAQNKEFRDNYLNLPFDLSRVFFITTANSLEGISRPLLDRMEVLELSGYSDQEKQEIARRYLIPRQQKEAGLLPEQLNFTDDAILRIIRRYTREAGVRQLERVIGRIARKRARQVLNVRQQQPASESQAVCCDQPIDAEVLKEMLGPEKYFPEKAREDMPPGVAQGLAWTQAGGDVLYIEATLVNKEEKVTLTGQLGSVMQESAQAARSYIWSAAEKLHIDRKRIDENGVHIHVPAGAVPKDGPSAGITIASALASVYTGRPLRPDIAMTGELTLSGLVLPVGGIKEKILAAHRAGIKHIVLPRENESDLQKLPEAVRQDIEVTFVKRLEEVLEVVLMPELPEQPVEHRKAS